jgi:glutamate-1-semialdehyde 2,1-aminomutase
MITKHQLKNSSAYREKIHSLIPGGAHTYTKGDDQFPLIAPAAIRKGKGSKVWDLDGNEYLDCSMGLTSVSLGHAYEPVLKAVQAAMEDGVNFQRPSYLEMEIAEAFLGLLPGHDMIKFAKNGSSVTTAAVKLARAYTNRKLVAFPVDHPFYSFDDWFIGKTVCNKGVPEDFTNLSVTYHSRDLSTLADLFDKYPGQIACVITEPDKPEGMVRNYLQEVSRLCKTNQALFIMDEMITGFKVDFPGAFSKYGVIPDLATWGKGIANGFSFCALTGKKEVMELGGITHEGSEKVFLISSTHGGETTALAACLATIKEFKELNVIRHNHMIGQDLIRKINNIIAKNSLSSMVEVTNAPWMLSFTFKDKSGVVSMALRTLILQEMIARGVLFQGAFVPCFSHTVEDVDKFSQAFDESLKIFSLALENGVENYLVGRPTKPVFRKIL